MLKTEFHVTPQFHSQVYIPENQKHVHTKICTQKSGIIHNSPKVKTTKMSID